MKKLTKSQLQKRCISPVSTLPAPSAILCDTRNTACTSHITLLRELSLSDKLPFELRCIIDFQLKSGCRISAVINNKGFRIDQRGKIYLHETKNDTEVAFYSEYSKTILKLYGPGLHTFLSYLSRFQVYRLYKKLGIDFIIENKSKASVCHAPRHLVAALVYNDTSSVDAVSKELNHKSLNSTKYYVNEKRK